ncbi:LPXTG cell wall anchor domain-containing protein [Clostridium perfringens]|nr:LPXTG cell wall anchor domain-containing protein [Clostridium perfringens]
MGKRCWKGGNLPNTGSPLGAGELMLVGAALATLGGVTIKKKK